MSKLKKMKNWEKNVYNSYHKGLISLTYKRFLGINKKSTNKQCAGKCLTIGRGLGKVPADLCFPISLVLFPPWPISSY